MLPVCLIHHYNLAFYVIIRICGNVRWLKKLESAEFLRKDSTGVGEDYSVKNFIIDEVYSVLQKLNRNADRNYIAEVLKVCVDTKIYFRLLSTF